MHLEAELPAEFDGLRLAVVTGRDLARVRFADADFEERDGSPAVIDTDLTGTRKATGELFAAGPVAGLCSGRSRIQIW